MNEVEHVAGGTAQAVQLDHGQLVPIVEEVHHSGQFVTTVPALAAGLLGADHLTSGVTKPGFLESAVLIGGGYPGVAVTGHTWGDPVTIGSTRLAWRHRMPNSTLL